MYPGSKNTEDKRSREQRLADQLRANLARRKQQARSRRDGDADRRPDGLPAAGSPEKDKSGK